MKVTQEESEFEAWWRRHLASAEFAFGVNGKSIARAAYNAGTGTFKPITIVLETEEEVRKVWMLFRTGVLQREGSGLSDCETLMHPSVVFNKVYDAHKGKYGHEKST